jgi:hypothetical protein
MMRNTASHLISSKYVSVPLHDKRDSPVPVSFPLCVRRMGHTFVALSASIALRV